MKKLFLLILVFLQINFAIAETTQGYDVLGVARYCKVFLRAPKLPAMSTLLNTFGDPLPCVEQRILDGQRLNAPLKLVQIDLIDATCWRNNKCPPGVPRPDDLKTIKKRAASVSVLAEKYPDVDFWISFALEHDIKDVKKVRKAIEAAKEGCPKCKMINSPFTGAKPPEYPLEAHGTKVSGFSVSGDGKSSFDADNIRTDKNGFEHRISGTNQTYAWFNEMNGRVTGEDTFTMPKQRTCWPTQDLFEQAYRVMQPEEPFADFPVSCKSKRSINSSKGEVWKTNAEAYSPCPHSDLRGNRPLFISKIKDDRLSLIDKAGKEVGCMKFYGAYSSPGMFRHYVGTCSKETPAQLYREAGGENLFIKRKNGECIRVNSVRRLGSFR